MKTLLASRANQPIEIFDVRLVGISAESGRKLLFSTAPS
jgi:hypothetical protein